jgi:D-alanyl-D-alanine carboxypeptidase/D-alanyl-D-alanine-endopeptidase (penicillin-binding protein 4)
MIFKSVEVNFMLSPRLRLVRNCALSMLLLCSVGWTEGLAQSGKEFSGLKSMHANGALTTGFAVNLRTGEVLGEWNPDTRVTPASVSKVVLAAAALERFGSEYSIETRFYSTGPVKNGVLKGDLVFEGAGDPSLTNEKLWFLTTDVARAGIRKVEGQLVVNTSRFGYIEPDLDRKLAARRSRHAYDSPLSAAAVNFSVMGVVVSPGDSPGARAHLALEPYDLDTTRVQGSVKTQGGDLSRVAVTRTRAGLQDVFTASGHVGQLSWPTRVYRSVSDADQYAGAVLKAFLEKEGIQIPRGVRIERQPRKDMGRPLASVEGFPMAWQLLGLFKVSNNFIADMMTILLDLDDKKQFGATLEGGANQLESYMSMVLQKAPKPYQSSSDGIVMQSGSGLTHDNKLSARDVVAVLQRMYVNSREFPSFLNALPVPGAEGTVKKRFQSEQTKHLRDRLRAKTGTLSEPHDAIGLAGYSRLKDGDWVAFCAMVNGSIRRPNVGIEFARETIDDDLGRLLPPEM